MPENIDINELASAAPPVSAAVQSQGFAVRPLNPLVYSNLATRFGAVTIANKGLEFQGRPIIKDGNGTKGYSKISSGEYYRVNCPFCMDTKKRLWVSYRYGVKDDWVGGYGTHLAVCYNDTGCLTGNSARLRQLEQWLVGINGSHRGQVEVLRGNKEEVSLRESDPPGSLISVAELPPDHQASLYLTRRGYDLQFLWDTYRVSLCVEGSELYPAMTGRITIPVFHDQVMVGWQGRFAADLNWKASGVPKYYNRPGMPMSRLLYNYDIARAYPLVVVQEGLTDVWSTGPFAVATFGGVASYEQMQLLASWRDGYIVVMADPDMREKAAATVPQLRAICENRVVLVDLPEGSDPGKFTPEVNRSIIGSAFTTAGFEPPGVLFQ